MKLSLVLLTKELRTRWMSITATSVYGLLFALMYVALFPSIRQNAAQLSQVISAMGNTLKAMGIQDLGFTSLESFFSMEYTTIVWPLMAIILAALLSGGMLAGEIETGTMGLLLAQPFGRARVYWTKFVAGLIALTVFTTFTIGASKPLAMAFNLSFSTNHYLKLIVMSLLLAWALFSFGMLISAYVSERSKVLSAIGGLAIVMYVLTAVSGLQDKFEWLKHLSYFSYYDAQNTLVKGQFAWSHVAVFAASIVLFAILGAVIFQRRDVSV